MSLRTRVAIAATAAIVLAVLLLVIAVPKLLARELRGSLDDTLRRRAADVAQLNASTPAELTQPGALEGRLTGGSLYVQVLDARGRLVVRSGALGGRVLPTGGVVRTALRSRQPGFADAALGTNAIRLYAAPLGSLSNGPGSGGAVIVAGTTADIDRTVDRARTLVAICALIAAAVAALAATLLTRRALLPLSRLSSGARAIERSGSASQRLPEPVTHDEIGQLAETLNAMLASLERARDAEHRFVGDVSHELRTPLTALRGNAAYAVRHGADPAVLADIEADANRLSTLLDDLLALAREDAATPLQAEPVDLVELARDASPDELVVVRPGTVRAEKPTLERAVGNLVANARRHGEGRVTITVDGDSIAVSDEGPGPRDPERAFERFFSEGGGSGLGLAIVKAIAERHGGQVTVDGSRFTVKDLSEMPRTTASSPQEGPSP
jgi:two-component system OmpR family sensor kinase